MKTNRLLFLLAITLLLLSSCAPKVYYQEAYNRPVDRNQFENDSIDLDIRYAVDAYQYLIFELDIENNSQSPAWVSGKDIKLYVREKETGNEYSIPMLNKRKLLKSLKEERELVDQEKKVGTTLGIVSAGLDLLAFAFTPGVSGIDAVFYSMESASFILEDRRQLELVKGDLEDQIQYIEDWIIDEEEIQPGESISYDLLFDRTLIDADVLLEIIINDRIYEFEYEFYIQEDKR